MVAMNFKQRREIVNTHLKRAYVNVVCLKKGTWKINIFTRRQAIMNTSFFRRLPSRSAFNY